MPQSDILIVELGSQHTLQIQRCLRELGHPSIILKPEEARSWLETNDPICAIGSGGYNSVYDADAPRIPDEVFVDRAGQPRFFLGICYAMQFLAHRVGLDVARGRPGYARATLEIKPSLLFKGLGPDQKVWMSHGDSIIAAESFRIIAISQATGQIAAIAHDNGRHFGVQFHPEVSHTENGKAMLRNFVEGIAGRAPDFKQTAVVETIQAELAARVGDSYAILGFSGGVDSTTLAKIAGGALGDRLLAILIDGGHLRENEVDEIKHHARCAGVNLKIIDASDEMIAAISKTTDSEQKRKAFRGIYAGIFHREAIAFAGGENVVILQATLAPDRIESGHTGGAKIKTHHNVGLTFGNLRQLHPFGSLYKDEVRKLARELGLPKSVFNRQPFPGPGNFLRVLVPVTREALSVTAWSEARVREMLSHSRTYRDVSQTPVAVLGRATGVKGDSPIYGYIVGVRSIRTKDFMTAEGVEFSPSMQRKIKVLLGEHPLITQVGFFPMDKPPGTTEFE